MDVIIKMQCAKDTMNCRLTGTSHLADQSRGYGNFSVASGAHDMSSLKDAKKAGDVNQDNIIEGKRMRSQPDRLQP